MTAAPGRPASLSSFFAPESIAIIGASDDIERIAGRPLHALRTYGYAGRLHVVNPTRPVVQGLPTVARIGDLPGPVDLAILVVPAKRVLEAARECAAAGTRHLVVFAGGFAETGDAGRDAQLELQQIGHAGGMRILGPNCLGMINFEARVFATFSRAAADWGEAGGAALQRGPRSLAVVTQSGALGNYMLTQAIEMGLQVGRWVATGNEVDIEFAEVLEAVIEDPAVCGVLAYLEGARKGPTLVRALRRARELKVPVGLIKVGSTEAGARAVMSHTDALAGDDRVFDALFAETGALRMHTIENLLGLGQLMLRARPAGGNRVLTTISGGER
ncbi:MAG: CoA-binding protein [Burkholderiaceae bacterium]